VATARALIGELLDLYLRTSRWGWDEDPEHPGRNERDPEAAARFEKLVLTGRLFERGEELKREIIKQLWEEKARFDLPNEVLIDESLLEPGPCHSLFDEELQECRRICGQLQACYWRTDPRVTAKAPAEDAGKGRRAASHQAEPIRWTSCMTHREVATRFKIPVRGVVATLTEMKVRFRMDGRQRLRIAVEDLPS
jgi:hypothetical protein